MAGPGESIRNGSADIRIALAYEPRIDRTIDNIYMGRLDIDYIGRLRSSEGWEAYLKVRQPITNDIDIPWQPEISDMTRISWYRSEHAVSLEKVLQTAIGVRPTHLTKCG